MNQVIMVVAVCCVAVVVVRGPDPEPQKRKLETYVDISSDSGEGIEESSTQDQKMCKDVATQRSAAPSSSSSATPTSSQYDLPEVNRLALRYLEHNRIDNSVPDQLWVKLYCEEEFSDNFLKDYPEWQNDVCEHAGDVCSQYGHIVKIWINPALREVWVCFQEKACAKKCAEKFDQIPQYVYEACEFKVRTQLVILPRGSHEFTQNMKPKVINAPKKVAHGRRRNLKLNLSRRI